MKALLAIALTAALSGAAYADCPYPAAPTNLPDGRTAMDFSQFDEVVEPTPVAHGGPT